MRWWISSVAGQEGQQGFEVIVVGDDDELSERERQPIGAERARREEQGEAITLVASEELVLQQPLRRFQDPIGLRGA